MFRSLQSPIVEKKKIIVKVMRVFQEETCDGSTFQEFCTTGVETNSKWSKTCSFPKTIRAQVLAEVLENTKVEENLIEVIQQLVLSLNKKLLFQQSKFYTC